MGQSGKDTRSGAGYATESTQDKVIDDWVVVSKANVQQAAQEAQQAQKERHDSKATPISTVSKY